MDKNFQEVETNSVCRKFNTINAITITITIPLDKITELIESQGQSYFVFCNMSEYRVLLAFVTCNSCICTLFLKKKLSFFIIIAFWLCFGANIFWKHQNEVEFFKSIYFIFPYIIITIIIITVFSWVDVLSKLSRSVFSFVKQVQQTCTWTWTLNFLNFQ